MIYLFDLIDKYVSASTALYLPGRDIRKSRSTGNRSRSPIPALKQRVGMGGAAALAMVSGLVFAAGAGGAEDPGSRALQQHQIQRQQQQDALQLRMRQQQRALQSPPQDAGQKQAAEQLQLDQRQRQQELHYRQSIEPATAQPSDDAGTRRANEAMEREKARRESEELQRRSGAEQRRK